MFAIKQKIAVGLAVVSAFSLAAALLFAPQKAQAAVPIDCPDGFQTTVVQPTPENIQRACAQHQTGGPGNDSMETRQALKASCSTEPVTAQNCAVMYYLLIFINALSALVGIVVVIMVAVGGVQYSAAKDNPQQAAQAKERIRNAILALVAYIFMVAFLQWLVPGGIL